MRLTILFLILILTGCQDNEIQKSTIYERTDPKPFKRDGGISPQINNVCEGKAWFNNIYGTYSNPIHFLTPVTGHFYFIPNYYQSYGYTMTLRVTNNNNYTLKLYKDGSYYGDIPAYGNLSFVYTKNCTCLVANCPMEEDVFYSFSVQPKKNIYFYDDTSVTVDATVNSPHTISWTGNFIFGT